METFLAFVVAGIFLFILIENRKLKSGKKQQNLSSKKGKKVSFYYLNFSDDDDELAEEEEFLEDLKKYKTITLHAVDENYIHGYCHSAKSERTYVREKIEYYTSGREFVDEMYEAYLDEYAQDNNNFISVDYMKKNGDEQHMNIVITSQHPMYFKGYVLEDNYDKFVMTFSYENILNVYRGEEFKANLERLKPIIKRIKDLTSNAKRTGINLIGFNDNEFLQLEELAKSYQLKVLKTQTKTLFAIITNVDLSENQIDKAKENGTLIMNKQQFLHFIETGEM